MVCQQNQTGTRHTGIVLFYDLSLSLPDRAVVLDVDQVMKIGFNHLKAVSPRAFEVPDNLYTDPVVKKNLQRRKEKPLVFGDMIIWDDDAYLKDRNRRINNFERTSSLWTCRTVNGEGQILLEGVIDPTRPYLFHTQLLSDILIPDCLIGELLPNVVCEAWITLKAEHTFDNNWIFNCEFNSIHGVCGSEKQLDVDLMPWNRDTTEFQTFNAESDSEDEERLIVNSKGKDGVLDLEISHQEAYMTGKRTFILKEIPDQRCILPWRKKNFVWRIGAKYFLDCFWVASNNAYYVSNAVSAGNLESMRTDTKSGLLMCNVVAHPMFRSIFVNDKLGLMDDPAGALALLHLTNYKDANIPVTIVDDGPSRHKQMRFTINGICSDSEVAKYDISIQNNINVTGVFGFVIEDGGYAAEHSPIVFKFSANDRPPQLGNPIIFDANYDSEHKTFKIKNWRIDPNRKIVPVYKKPMEKSKNALNSKQAVYFVNAKLVTVQDDHEMFYCEEFGLLDDCFNIVPLSDANNYQIWIKQRSPAETFAYSPRTPFYVVATGNKYPAAAQKVVKDECDLITSIQQKLHVSKEKVEHVKCLDKSTNLFVSCDSSPSRSEDTLSAARPDIKSDAKNNTISQEHGNEATLSNGSSSSSINRWNCHNDDRYFGFKWARDKKYASDNGGDKFGECGFGFQEPFGDLTNFVPPGNGSDSDSIKIVNPIMSHSDPEEEYPNDLELTEMGDIDPARHLILSPDREVNEYKGIVMADPGSGFKYDVVETFSRIKNNLSHGNCGNKCSRNCPWLLEVARVVTSENGEFVKELKMRHPKIAAAVMESLQNID